jgi:hypothetical protein
MNPPKRNELGRIAMGVLLLVAIGGFLFAGPVHATLYEHHGQDCIACQWVGLDPAPPPPLLETPVLLELVCTPQRTACHQRTCAARLIPRAPPVSG